METLVLCPEELCLGPGRLTVPSGLMGLSPAFASDFSIWTSGDLEKGTRFLPWKGTVRSDKLPVHDKLPEFDVSNICINIVCQSKDSKITCIVSIDVMNFAFFFRFAIDLGYTMKYPKCCLAVDYVNVIGFVFYATPLSAMKKSM